jgi:carboxylesterase
MRDDLSTPAAQPFYLPGGDTGCLLLHGLTGTPQEMRFLGERLHAQGYSVRGVRLAGHGTSLDDLARCRWEDWYASARRGLTALPPAPVVVGLSMGALLALKLAADEPAAVRAVAVLSPALVVSNPWLYRLAPLFPLLLALTRPGRLAVRKWARDIADPEAQAASPSYTRIPLRALQELVRLQRVVRGQLARVHQPALVLYALHDHTCSAENVRLLERGLGGPVRTLPLARSQHVISVGFDKERVAAAVGAFVAAVAAPGRTS